MSFMGYVKQGFEGLTDAQKKVLDALEELRVATPSQLLNSKRLAIGRVMLHRHLKVLVSKGLIVRNGSPPKVYYQYISSNADSKRIKVDLPDPGSQLDLNRLDENFAYTSGYPLLLGIAGFNEWFRRKQIPNLLTQRSKKKPLKDQVNSVYQRCLEDYCKLRKELESQRVKGHRLFDGTGRYHRIHDDHYVDQVFYLDFYSLPIFGKTKLGYYVQKSKVGDKKSIRFIDEISKMIYPTLEFFILKEKIDAILWVPHSLSRPVSLMDELRKNFLINIPSIKVMKAFPAEVIPQKSISNLDARIENALSSNHILTSREQLAKYKHILIVDDAIGSNSTIHSLGFKIKQSRPKIQISAMSIVGSFKGFDVIQDI